MVLLQTTMMVKVMNRKPFKNDRRKRSRGMNIFLTGRNRNKNTENLTKSERLMKGVGIWTSFYRANPHRFVRDYFGINLKIFQQILIVAMIHNNYFMYLASRGQGCLISNNSALLTTSPVI